MDIQRVPVYPERTDVRRIGYKGWLSCCLMLLRVHKESLQSGFRTEIRLVLPFPRIWR